MTDIENLDTWYAPPKTVTFTMNAAATYRYYCSIHPGLMDGKVVAQAPTS